MYRLIASDVDGTLVPEGTSDINPQLFEYILKLKEQGIRFVAASGRQYASIRHAFRPVRDEILFIADNGAFIYEKDRMLVCKTFPFELYADLIRYLKKTPGLYLMISSVEGSFTDCEDDSFLSMMMEGYGLSMERVADLTALDIHVSKIGVYCTAENPKELAEEGRKQYGDAADIYVSGKKWMDYMPKGISKGAGLNWIQSHLNISREETIAFGDQNNDISMLQRAGASYAVAGAKPDVKAAVSHVMTEGPEEDGVFHVLREIFTV